MHVDTLKKQLSGMLTELKAPENPAVEVFVRCQDGRQYRVADSHPALKKFNLAFEFFDLLNQETAVDSEIDGGR